MTEFVFDVKLLAIIRVEATDEAAARKLLKEKLSRADANFGVWADGNPILEEASLDGESDLIEIDGEEAL